jgi:hypothetical protein
MARPTVIYNCQALFVGPAPESGYNFFDYNGGAATNDHEHLVQKINRLSPIDRVQSVSYQINVPHENILQLSKRSTVDRPVIDYPTVDLSFNYLLCGTKNEARLGFNVNYPVYNFPFSGEPYYSNNTNVSLLKGFFEEDKSYVQGKTWEVFDNTVYRDCKNIYLVVNQDGNDINKFYQKEEFGSPDIYQSIDPSSPDYHVISFGNCYLTNYSTNGSIGRVPAASASFRSYNVNFDMSGSGFQAPGIESKSGSISPEKDVVIPRVLANEGYPALKPGDITLTTDSFSGLGVDFDKLHVQSYEISMSLNREPLNSLGYKFPLDNKATSPVFTNFSMRGIVDSGSSGSLTDIIKINSCYDFTIKVDPKNCPKSTSSPINAGTIPINTKVESLRYTFLGAKLDDFNYETNIGSNKIFEASFSVEAHPEPHHSSNGFFISGVLGMEKIEDFILLEGTANGEDQNGYYLQQETNDLLVTNLIPPY